MMSAAHFGSAFTCTVEPLASRRRRRHEVDDQGQSSPTAQVVGICRPKTRQHAHPTRAVSNRTRPIRAWLAQESFQKLLFYFMLPQPTQPKVADIEPSKSAQVWRRHGTPWKNGRFSAAPTRGIAQRQTVPFRDGIGSGRHAELGTFPCALTNVSLRRAHLIRAPPLEISISRGLSRPVAT